MNPEKTKFDLESLDLLNAWVEQIYHRKKHYVAGKDLFALKGSLAESLVRIERVFCYAYSSDISLNSELIDKRLFREQFPFLYEQLADNRYVIYDEDGNQEVADGITYYTWMLKRFRNINLHAIVSTPLHYTMRVDESFIRVFPPIADGVNYARDGKLTIAGMFIMILAALSQDDLRSFIANFANVWGAAVWGERGYAYIKGQRDALAQRLNDTFRSNYEVNIREQGESGDLLESIFGRLYHETAISDAAPNVQRFALDLADRVKAPRFRISGRLEKTPYGYSLMVDQGSNIGRHFESDYVLAIKNVEAFIDICNRVPPIMGVAYLCQCNITELQDTADVDMEKLLKLNKPKFYRDKNLTILCSGDKFADLREIGKSASAGVQKAFLNLEEKFVFELDIPVYNTYSRLSLVLERLKVSSELGQRLVALRNFAAHCGILNDFYFYSSEGGYYLDLPFIAAAFNDFAAFLDATGKKSYAEYVRKNYHFHVLNNLLGVKYKRIVQASLLLFRQDGDRAKENCSGIEKSLHPVAKSVIDAQSEEALAALTPYKFYFNIPPYIYRLTDNKYYFSRLTLVRIQGDNLGINGTDLERQELTFFLTPATDFNRITSNGASVDFELVESHVEGIVTVQTYHVKEKIA